MNKLCTSVAADERIVHATPSGRAPRWDWPATFVAPRARRWRPGGLQVAFLTRPRTEHVAPSW